MKDMEQFFTRQKANNGIRVPLSLPDGTPTEHWLQVRGVDSDAFRAAEVQAKRAVVQGATWEQARLDLLASVVCAWSFDKPCEPEAVRLLLTEAPQLADQIDKVAADRAAFFNSGSRPLSTGPAKSSG